MLYKKPKLHWILLRDLFNSKTFSSILASSSFHTRVSLGLCSFWWVFFIKPLHRSTLWLNTVQYFLYLTSHLVHAKYEHSTLCTCTFILEVRLVFGFRKRHFGYTWQLELWGYMGKCQFCLSFRPYRHRQQLKVNF